MRVCTYFNGCIHHRVLVGRGFHDTGRGFLDTGHFHRDVGRRIPRSDGFRRRGADSRVRRSGGGHLRRRGSDCRIRRSGGGLRCRSYFRGIVDCCIRRYDTGLRRCCIRYGRKTLVGRPLEPRRTVLVVSVNQYGTLRERELYYYLLFHYIFYSNFERIDFRNFPSAYSI